MEIFTYDSKSFTPGDDPTYIYSVESVAPPIRDAIRMDRLHAVVEFPPHHGRGTRPPHVKVELTYCGYPGGAAVFDHPDKINRGWVKFIRADGEELEFNVDYMSWEDLSDRLHDFMIEWGTQLRGELQAAHRARKQFEEAEQAVARAKHELKQDLRVIRKRGGLSVAEIARLVGMPERTVQAYLK